MLLNSSFILLYTFKYSLKTSLVSLFKCYTIPEKRLKFLLEHDLSHLTIGSFYIDKFFFTLDFICLFDCHFSLSFDSLDITSVSSFEVRVSNNVVNVDKLLLISL